MYKRLSTSKPNVLMPTLSEVVFFFLISLFLLFLFSYSKIMSNYGFHVSANDLPEGLAKLGNSIYLGIFPNLAVAGLWAFAGLGIYFILWISADTLTRINEAHSLTHRFIYPNEEHRHLFFFTMFGQLYLRASACILLIGWGLLLLKLISVFANYFYADGFSFESVLAVIAFGAYLFLAAPIARLIVLRPRVFSDTE